MSCYISSGFLVNAYVQQDFLHPIVNQPYEVLNAVINP